MRIRLVLLVALAGCDAAVTGSYAGPALVTIRGQASVPEGRTVPEPVRLALVWTDEQGRRSVMEGNTRLQSPWPTRFSFSAMTVPASSSDGVVVAYADVNTTEALELADNDDGGTPDVVLGASVNVFRDGGTEGTVLRFLDGRADIPQGLRHGFNLIGPDGGAFNQRIKSPNGLPVGVSATRRLHRVLPRTARPQAVGVSPVCQTATEPQGRS